MKLFRLFPLMIAALLGFVGCEENTQVDETPDPVVELKADKQVITADGEDMVTFTVFVDKVERTADCKIICLKDNSILDGRTFATTEVGEYSFKASFESYASEAVSIVAEGIESCEAPVLIADKTEIYADGEDMVTFTVTYEDKDVTTEATIYNLTDDCALEGNTFSTTTNGHYKFEARLEGCPVSSVIVDIYAEPKDDPAPVEVTLEVDKTEIKADGTDVATFTVKADGEIVTEDVFVFYLATNKPVKDMQFTTTEAGEHKFLASYGSDFSEEITITATAVETPELVPIIELTADKSTFVADGEDKITFTVTSDDVALESGYTIYLVGEQENVELKNNFFVTSQAGEYKFKAVVEEYESKVISVTATEPEPIAEPKLTLTADKTEIVADGIDAVIFEVKEENFMTEDVSLIYNLADNSVVRGPFTTTTAGTYEFVARRSGVESNKVTVVVKAVEPEEPEEPEQPEQPEQPAKEYKVGDIYDEGGNKGLVFAFKEKAIFDAEYNIIGYTNYGYVMSFDEGYAAWSTEEIFVNCTSSGKINTEEMVKRGIDKYPAAKWCVEHGTGWFMPSANEMGMMWNMLTNGEKRFDAESVAKYNKLFVDNGGDVIEEAFYWSSSEIDERDAETFAFLANSIVCDEPYKYKERDVRAVYMFEAGVRYL
ncbi:MAG: hypothetical protein J6R81_02875 [Alistipes sp.]|nr:hypothetical protein [Alistipes sp.]